MKKRDIENILDEIGVELDLSGYQYLIEAVLIKAEAPDIRLMEIYEKIAKKHKDIPSSVERTMRFIHNKHRTEIKKYFKLKTTINNGIFIAALVREAERRTGNGIK